MGSQVEEGSTWIVVPVRSLTDGKRRLAPVLDSRERAALVRRMLVRTLRAAGAAGPPVLVVSPDADALSLAGDHGAAGLEEPRPIGLNRALTLAAHAVRERGGDALLVVSADLPDLEAADLRAMLPSPVRDRAAVIAPPTAPATAAPSAARGGGAAGSGSLPGQAALRIAPDEAGTGTNALYVRSPRLARVRVWRRELHPAPGRKRGHSASASTGSNGRGSSSILDTPADLERYERSRPRETSWGM